MKTSLSRFTVISLTCLVLVLALLVEGCGRREASPPAQSAGRFGIVVHGGAGGMSKDRTTPEKEAAYRQKLTEAIQAGHKILNDGGASLDAVEAAVRILEDSPLFNAGKGAVFTAAGANELDASIMDGRTLKAGAVASVRRVKNPITLARLVMEKSENVLLVGEGAETFAASQGVELVDPKYFFTQERWDELQRIKAREKESGIRPGVQPAVPSKGEGKHGTVGAVALDKHGNLAAATSTGGRTNKSFGRVGDSPIIGAGTYANNRTCAISATGHGEYFIRLSVCYDISALMEYKGMTLAEAARRVVKEKLTQLGGTGGIVAIDKDGNLAMPFNTSGMYRGHAIGANPKIFFAIFED